MKKKVLIIIAIIVLLVIGLFVLTGCAADNEELSSDGRKKESFYELKYVEPKGYASVSEYGNEDNKSKNYTYGQFDGSININYKKGKYYSEVENLYYNEHIEKDINGTTWRVMDDDSVGIKSRFYYTVYNNNLYLIELNGIDKYQNEMEEFIKNVSFK